MSADISLWLSNQFYNRIVGTVLPLSWFTPIAPDETKLAIAKAPVKLQVVSHCWNYAHLSLFQLSSIVNYPPEDCELTYTLFHAEEDTGMRELIKQFDRIDVPNVTWDWQVLPKAELFRRAIGRNKAALSSTADWIWFADCDLIFHKGCLDSVAAAVKDKQVRMIFPDHEGVTDLLPPDHAMLNQTPEEHGTIDVDPTLFQFNKISKAKGAFQIVHGDVARAVGYCQTINLYQTPSERWRKTYEDTVFRRLIDSEGEAVNIENLFRIRHAEKGRYAKDSRLSLFRKKLRKATDSVASQ